MMNSCITKPRPLLNPPMIVRVAGVPAARLGGFSSPDCEEKVRALLESETKLRAVRLQAVEELHFLIGSIEDQELRCIALQLKRDFFNQREISGSHRFAELKSLQGLEVIALGKILDLETQVVSRRKSLEEAYGLQWDHEGRLLAACAMDETLLRGMSLASPGFWASLHQYYKSAEGKNRNDRKTRRLERSLIRYLSRSALKLSPYSTFTSVGLGLIRDDLHSSDYQLLPGWRRGSLLRIKRYIADQIAALVLELPAVRQICLVSLNDTAEEVEPDTYRFLVPGRWAFDENRNFRHQPESRVKIRLAGRLIRRVQALLGLAPRSYGTLVALLAGETDAGEEVPEGLEVSSTLDRLIRVGYLQLLPPWSCHEVHLEKRILELLRSLPLEGKTKDVIPGLARLLSFEERNAGSLDHPVLSGEASDLIDDLWARLQEASDPRTQADLFKGADDHHLYEDIVMSSVQGAVGEVFRLSSAKAQELRRSAQALWDFASLYSHRNDLLAAASEFLSQRWPGSRVVRFLDFVYEFQPLWRDYLSFEKEARQTGYMMSTFNPLDLPVVSGLAKLREEVLGETIAMTSSLGELGVFLAVEDLEIVLRRVPELYRSPVGWCAFVQPLGPEGSQDRRWLLNRIFEGTGRYGSRFTAAMTEEMRDFYLSSVRECSSVEQEGEKLELLDLMRIQGSAVNLHWLQTRAALEMPGEWLEIPPDERIRLKDLWIVVLDNEKGALRLSHSSGRSFLPVHLGTLSNFYLPPLAKLLSVFGPFEARQALPVVEECRVGDLWFRDRLTVGNLVVRRRRWKLRYDSIARDVRECSGAKLYEQVNRWRMMAGLPGTVFLSERVERGKLQDIFKPQFIDFSSPTFVDLFAAIVRNGDSEDLVFEECLPSREDLPRGDLGQRWALELQLDSIVLRGEGEEKGSSILSQERVPSEREAVE